MKKIVYVAFVAFLMCLVSCSNDKGADPKIAPTKAMLNALDKLTSQDIDGYLACAYLEGEDDSTHIELLKQLLNQQHQYQVYKKGDIDKYDVVDVKFTSDSVCTVLYQYVFSDSTKETCSQKMVRIDGDWKVRIRN